MVIKIILLIVASILAFIGYKKKIIDNQALIFVLFFAFYFIALFPIYFFISLLILYLATSIATKYKTNLKAIYHKKGRSIYNLLSNLLIAILFSILYLILKKNPLLYFGFLSSIACACADTLASEIGQLSKGNPRLITTLEEVRKGTEGGVSPLGLTFGLVGSSLVASPSFYYFGFNVFIIITIIGFIGCNIDSFIGAHFELRGKCNNETTNLIATLSSGILGLLVFSFLF